MTRRCLCFIFLLGLTGCSSQGPEELDRLAKEDPAFKQMVLSRDQARAEIHSLKRDLLIKKKIADAQVQKLKQEVDAYAKAQNLKMEKARAVIDADRAALKRRIDAASADLELKQAELEKYEKTLANAKKILRETKGFNLSADEKQKWEERILLLSEKIRPLREEVEDLKIHIRMDKRKMGFLK